MNKKKFVVLALMMIAIIALSSCLFVACDKDSDSNTDNDSETIEATEDLLISNGDFKVIDTTSSDYPRTITNWTGAKMYSSGSYKDDVTAGAISLDKALYDANKSKWDDEDGTLYNLLTANGKYDDDDIKNALMIYMPELSTDDDGNKVHGPTAYGYTSSNFTLERGSYYRLKVDVLTYNIGGLDEDDRGARIYVSSNTYAEFDGIDTNGQWKTYEIIIESSSTSSTTLSVMLGLGKYSASYTTGLTTGYAVFDNLSLEKIEEENGEKEYNDAVLKELNKDDNITTATLKVSNGRFDFGTTTISSSGTPNGWSLVTGNSSESDSAPTSLGYNGIIDVNDFADNFEKYSSTYQLNDSVNSTTKSYIPAKETLGAISNTIGRDSSKIVGSNVFMLSQQMMTAQGIKSSRSITIEKNKTYALSIDLYTYNVHGAGVSLVLTGSDGKDITIKGISSAPSDDALIGSVAIDKDCSQIGGSSTDATGATTGGWQTYTFYIKGNQYRDYNYTMTIWLGTEGTNSNTAFPYTNTNGNAKTTYLANGTFSNGWVFIDELNLKEQDNLPDLDDPAKAATILGANSDQTLDISDAGNGNFTALCVDLTSFNLFKDILTGSNATTNSAVTLLGTGAPQDWTSEFDATDTSNPIISTFISEGVVNIASEEEFSTSGTGTYPGLPYDIENKVAYQLNASSDSYYEVQSKSFVVEKNHFYRVSLWVKTVDIKSTSGAYVYLINCDNDDATLTSFTQINTNDEDGFDAYFNDWCELTIYIRGSQKEDTNVALKFTLGTGNRWASDTLATGSMFVTNISGTDIDYTTFNGASTGTYVKSVSLSESAATYTFTNGGFDEYDESDTNLAESTPLNEQKVAGTPSSWSFSDKTLNPNEEGSNLVAGVIALDKEGDDFKGSAQTNALFGNDVNFTNFYPSFNSITNLDDFSVLPGNKGQLLVIGSKTSDKFAAGFASQSKTLSENGFYSISVWVKTVNNAKASIYLTGESAVQDGTSSTFEVTSTQSNTRNDWTKYTYYFATGQNSVSVTLNLWLGLNKDYVELADGEEAESSGAVFFDNIVYTTLTEDEFDANTEDITTIKKLSFTVDSFDSLSSTTESKKELSTPNGWTGTVGSASGTSSKYTNSGIIYVDSNFLEVKKDNAGNEYVDILGKDYDPDSDDDELKLTDEEAAEAGDDDQKIADIKNEKAEALKKANWFLMDDLKKIERESGKQLLVINNTRENVYTYTSNTMTLKEESYYKVSVWVNTINVSGKDKDDENIAGANIELYLGSANESDNPFIFKAIKTDGAWTQYTFYVQTLDEDVTSVTVKLSLGRSVVDEDDDDIVYGLTRGYAFFDDVQVEKLDDMDEDGWSEIETNEKVLTRTVSNETSGESDDEEEDNTSTSSGFNTEYLWWMIPTIVLAVLIIVVLVIYLVRKLKKPVSKKATKRAASLKETPSLDTKHDKYDENKE